MKWELIQRPRELGGLGVGDVIIKNAALLFKWWCWFCVEEKPLWKRIICLIHVLNPNKSACEQETKVRGCLWSDV